MEKTDTCLIACPIFQKELEKVLAELNFAPSIHYMHYTVHSNPLMMEEELRSNIDQAGGTGERIRFLVGGQCKAQREITEIVENCNGVIPEGRNCLDMLIGDELVEKFQKNRTTLMTPAWIRMITRSITEGQWTLTDARLQLGWYDKILILDTGVDPLSDEQVMEFYDLTQVEITVLPVDLNYFKSLIKNLLQG